MKQLSLIGRQLIHTYPLIPRFNGCDLAKAEEMLEATQLQKLIVSGGAIGKEIVLS